MNFVNMMMTMDPRLSLPTVSGQDAAVLPAMEGGVTDSGFADLLGLVSDMEVAESQDAEAEIFSDAQIEGMMSRDAQGLQASKMEAQLLMGMPQAVVTVEKGNAEQQSVGRTTEQVLLGSETRLAQDLSLEGLKSQMIKGQAMQQIPDSEAVAQWSAALASGDIAAITVEPANASSLASEQALSALRSEANGKAADLPQQAVTKQVVTKQTVTKQMAPEPLVAADSKGEAMNAQDFMLERASDMSFSSRIGGPAGDSATVVAAQDLGSPQDPRVSARVVDFVADKVEALRAQGGGTLKVEMANSDLGGLTMQVSKRLGQVEVRISADRPETQRLLEASKSELSARLQDKVGPSLVEFSTATRGAEVAVARSAPIRSTEQLLDMRHNALSNEAPSTNRSELRDVSMKDASLSREMGGDGFQRQERRERAMDKWEEQVLRQKSA
jgi:hypothetical protein